jgi:hypothetical protein
MQTASQSKSYALEDWRGDNCSFKQEFDYWIEDIEGEIPHELNGTLFRNGPGLLDVNGRRITHPFDGDGMICAIAFSQGCAHFRNRFVRTEEYCAEQKAGRMLYRGRVWYAKARRLVSECLRFTQEKCGEHQCNLLGWKADGTLGSIPSPSHRSPHYTSDISTTQIQTPPEQTPEPTIDPKFAPEPDPEPTPQPNSEPVADEPDSEPTGLPPELDPEAPARG